MGTDLEVPTFHCLMLEFPWTGTLYHQASDQFYVGGDKPEATMQQLLTPGNVDAVMNDYHGFHDAQINWVVFRPTHKENDLVDAEVELWAMNHSVCKAEVIRLLFHDVVEMKFSYNKKYDYSNIQFDIAIGFHEELAHVDFGGACEPRTTPDDYRELDRYFICRVVSLTIVE